MGNQSGYCSGFGYVENIWRLRFALIAAYRDYSEVLIRIYDTLSDSWLVQIFVVSE